MEIINLVRKLIICSTMMQDIYIIHNKMKFMVVLNGLYSIK